MDRRTFLTGTAIAGLALGTNKLQHLAFGAEPTRSLETVVNEEYPFPYDDINLECSPRIFFLTPEKANLTIIPKRGKTLAAKLYVCYDQNSDCSAASSTVQEFVVNGSIDIDIPIPTPNLPSFTYWLEYREGNGNLNATPKRVVKTPLGGLNDPIEMIAYSDQHPFDDADREIQDPFLRDAIVSGEHYKILFRGLRNNPLWQPEGELGSLKQAYSHISAMTQIRKHNPDLLINLGDDNGGGFHKLSRLLGFSPENATREQLFEVELKLRLGMLKGLSDIVHNTEVCWALGNHDGEAGFYNTQEFATDFRKKFFLQPGAEEGCSKHQNYYFKYLGTYATGTGPFLTPEKIKLGKVLLIVLDPFRYLSRHPETPYEWTLGTQQKAWFENVLKTYDAEWKIVAFHHELGGWPAGSSENETTYAYGRGPLFLADDYASIGLNPDNIEQVALTKLMRTYGVNIILYGHDHIFFSRRLGTNSKGREMYAICVGSTKYDGEQDWWNGYFWQRFYGSFREPANFYGPPGFTKLTFSGGGAQVDYIRSAPSPHTNIPDSVGIGGLVKSIIL